MSWRAKIPSLPSAKSNMSTFRAHIINDHNAQSNFSLSHSAQTVTCTYTELDKCRQRPHPTSWRFSLTSSSRLLLNLPSDPFPTGFPTKVLYALSLCPIRAICPRPSHYFFDQFSNLFVIKPTRCTNFTDLSWNYMFRAVRLSIIRSLFIVHSPVICHTGL